VSKKTLGETVLGWFVVREDDEEEKSPEQLIDQYANRKSAPAVPANPPPSMKLEGEVPMVAAGRTVDATLLQKVYQAAKITNDEQERVKKALGLVESLPAETPYAVKRQIVEASLKAFGVPIEQIVETGVEQIQALEAYIQHGARHTQSVLQDAQARIEKLQADIMEIKKLMEMQVTTQQNCTKSCNEEKIKVQHVLEFFGQEMVAKVVRDSPKLVEP
jgi:hypothetical protein